MEKEQLISVKEAVHKLQLSLLEGIRHENQLFAAGSLLSRSDYEDVVKERSISNICGYPLCSKRLNEQAKKGRYRISLKEHKVYDLSETYMFCSSGCLINSRAFGGALEEERCSVLNPPKIDEVLKLFEELSLDKDEGLGENEDLGFSDLRIEEKVNVGAGEVSLEDWMGPSNAIEGYVPNLDFSAKASTGECGKEGSESIKAKPKKGKGKIVSEKDFTSSIIVGDQFGVPRFSYGPEVKGDKEKTLGSKQSQFCIHGATSAPMQNGSKTKLKESKSEVGRVAPEPQFGELEMFHGTIKNVSDRGVEESKPEECGEKLALSIESILKSSMKPSGGKHFSTSVLWADERKIDNTNNGNVQDMGNMSHSVKSSSNSSVGVIDGCSCLASVDDRELAPNQVAKVVPFGESDVTNDEAGTIISLQRDARESDSLKNEDVSEPLVVPFEQPKKPGIPISESFDVKDFSCRTSPALEKQQPITSKDAVHKLQLSLLEGIHYENQLSAVQSLITRSDYDDVVTKRSLANICGYPLCNNPLPTERLQKDHRRISLKQSKGHNPRETKMFCSTGCATNSRAFSGRLQVKRCLAYNSIKINEILKLFGEPGLNEKENSGKNNDLQELKIDEKVSVKVGDASLEDCIPFDSTGGRIPEVHCVLKPSPCGCGKGGAESNNGRLQKGKGKVVNEMDPSSTITAGDQYGGLKMEGISKQNGSEKRKDESKHNQFSSYEATLAPVHNVSEEKLKESMVGSSRTAEETHFGKQEIFLVPTQNGFDRATEEPDLEVSVKKTTQSNVTTLKSSLRSFGRAKRLSRSVTWADEKKVNDTGSGDLCTFQEIGEIHDTVESSRNSNVEDVDDSLRLASAEACALALSQVADAISSGEFEIADAVSDAGIIILPQLHDYDGESEEDANVLEPETDPLKSSDKPAVFNSKLFNAEDSWYDAPPEGFSLTLSSFATMWAALFGWITSSSLAYIYGWDASFHEEFILVNGKQYPCKTFLSDGRSSEIKQSLAGVLARTVPELVTELRLRVPLSALEHGMECLLDTMSFLDPLPSLGTEQWHVLALLFIDALSVCRIPGLSPYMTSMRMRLHKVLQSARMTWEEYESMKDIIIPLGRRPQFSAQSGG